MNQKVPPLLYYELRKLLMKPVFLLLILFMTAVLLVRFYMNCEDLDVIDRDVYRRIQKEISSFPEDEARSRLQRERTGLLLAGFFEKYDSSKEEREYFSIQFSELAKPYGMTALEMAEEYAHSAENTEERQTLLMVLSALEEQYRYMEEYRKFIDELPLRAEEMKEISVFSRMDSYSYRSIQKGVEDFLRLGKTEIRPDYDQGVKAMGLDYASILFVFILILGAAVILFSEEEENGLMRLLKTTRKGHASLAAAKWGALLLSAVFFSLLIYGGQVLTASLRLGFGDLSRALQSVPDFRDCCYPLSVGGYLIFSVLLPMVSAIGFASVTAFLAVLLKKPWLSAGTAAIFVGVLYVFYRFLTDNAAMNVLKFANLFSLSDVSARFSAYYTVNLFGFPVSVLPTAITAGAVLLSIGGAGCIFCFSKDLGLHNGFRFSLRRKIRICGSVKPFVQEHYRLYIGAFGLIVLSVFLFLGYRKLSQDEPYLSEQDYLYYAYGQEIAGEITDETGQWLQKKQQEIHEGASGWVDENADMTEQERTEARFLAISKGREAEEKQRVLLEIQEELMTLERARVQGIPVHYISRIQTDPVFHESTSWLLSSLLLMLLCLVFCPMFSQDEESGMGRLVHTTKYGQDRIFFTRYLVMLLFYTAVFLLFFLPELIHWQETVRMTDWEAPLQSVVSYVDAEGDMTLLTFMILWISGSYLSGLGFMVLMSLLSKYCRKNSTTMIVAAVVIAGDFLVNLLGFPLLSSLVLSSGFAMTQMPVWGGKTWIIYALFLKNALAAAVLFVWHRKVYLRG